LSQIDNVSPNSVQSYISTASWSSCSRRRQSLGYAGRRHVAGRRNKLLEPVAGAVLGKIVILVLLVLFIQRRPRGLFP